METFFGHGIDPRGNIIGILIATITGAWVERQVRRFIPANLDIILTSAITLLIMGALTFIVIMPIGVCCLTACPGCLCTLTLTRSALRFSPVCS